MKKFALAAALLISSVPAEAGLFGPPKFKVTQSDDRFSTDGSTTFTGFWNRISKKSVAGGVHIDTSGVFVEPLATKSRLTGEITSLHFFIHNELSEDSAGMGNLLALGELRQITFLADDGPPIALQIERSARDRIGPVTYNTISRMAEVSVSETGFASIQPGDFQRIMNARTLLAKVDGSQRSMTYEARDISKTFQQNLRAFWDGYVSTGNDRPK